MYLLVVCLTTNQPNERVEPWAVTYHPYFIFSERIFSRFSVLATSMK